jgi:hypothetical protein
MTDNKSNKPTIFEAFAAAMAEVQAVRKGDRNQQQGYSFRGIDAVVNAVGPVFRKHGIVPIPHKSEARYRDVQTSTGKPSRECTVTVTYRFYGPAGDFIEAEVPGESMDFGDKGAPKAMSVAFRIALLQALCIPTDEPEPDSQTYERSAPQQRSAGPQSETDWDWGNKFETRVGAAMTEGELKGLWSELVVKHERREVTDEDANTFRQLISMRKGELNHDGEAIRA